MNPEFVRANLSYDPDTGVFVWKSPRRGVRVGARAGRKNGHGYREIGVEGKLVGEHRLAFAMILGREPNGYVDHINGIRDDNRWDNLRECTQSQNMANVPLQRDNTSGVSGVTWDNDRQMWRAQIRIGGVKKNLGRFKCIEDAARIVHAAAKEQWGEFVR